eukprot:TRINITY_DN20176_c0_g1_i1.p1 TRINITY_DN20176_c0_g1~~TRINITY_DN20176_c0_g1_i1.p1  ORF type:complete len:272 (+),score=12.05 TRINITY_DN20176_c0_g1_i1:386-1201(+)
MKKFVIYSLALAFSAGAAFSQMPPSSKPDEELTKEEAGFRIQDFQTRVSALEAKLNEATTKYNEVTAQLKKAIQDNKDCREEIKKLLGASDADFEAFRQKIGVLEGKVREMKRLSDDQLADKTDDIKALENEVNALRANKLSCIEEFYNKIIALAREVKGLYREKKISGYKVGTWAEDRDCLWNISGKVEIYGDPFQWPKLWEANKDIVRNPDVIFPGQLLKVPPKGPKTDDQMKLERKYWRNKKAAEAKATEEKVPTTKEAPTTGVKKGN